VDAGFRLRETAEAQFLVGIGVVGEMDVLVRLARDGG
jgi:hypothetical protein